MTRDRAAQRQFKIDQAKALSHEWPEATRENPGPPANLAGKSRRRRGLDPTLRAAVISRDGGCVAAVLVPTVTCRGQLQAHHLWRVSQGGPDAMWNLKTVCGHHHDWIHHNIDKARAVDLIRRRGDTGPEGPRIGP